MPTNLKGIIKLRFTFYSTADSRLCQAYSISKDLPAFTFNEFPRGLSSPLHLGYSSIHRVSFHPFHPVTPYTLQTTCQNTWPSNKKIFCNNSNHLQQDQKSPDLRPFHHNTSYQTCKLPLFTHKLLKPLQYYILTAIPYIRHIYRIWGNNPAPDQTALQTITFPTSKLFLFTPAPAMFSGPPPSPNPPPAR